MKKLIAILLLFIVGISGLYGDQNSKYKDSWQEGNDTYGKTLRSTESITSEVIHIARDVSKNDPKIALLIIALGLVFFAGMVFMLIYFLVHKTADKIKQNKEKDIKTILPPLLSEMQDNRDFQRQLNEALVYQLSEFRSEQSTQNSAILKAFNDKTEETIKRSGRGFFNREMIITLMEILLQGAFFGVNERVRSARKNLFDNSKFESTIDIILMSEHRQICDDISSVYLRNGKRLYEIIDEDLRSLFYTVYHRIVAYLIRDYKDLISSHDKIKDFHDNLKYGLTKENNRFIEILRHDDILD